MASTRTFLIDASTRHAIFVQRFAGGQINEILPFLERARKKTVAILNRQSITQATRKRQQQILAEINQAVKELYSQMGKALTANMKEFAVAEAEFSVSMFQKGTNTTFNVPTGTAISSAVFSSPLLLTDDALDIESALRQLSVKKRQELVRTIKDGMIVGATNDEIIKDVNVVARTIQKQHASSLVRTITNHVSTAARTAVAEANKDVVEGYEWVSTLDAGTTATCQALDGKELPLDTKTKPPIHWGCRSALVARVKKKYRIFDKASKERPSVGASGPKTVKGNTTYNSWLKKQPASFQDEVLGKGKGKLFREGGLNVGSFVDKKFQPLTLKQLKQKEPLAFERAGLVDKE